MTDHLTKEKRSWNMSRIRSKDSKPERIVRTFLHKNCFRFRLYSKDMPGKPDIILPKYRSVVFVHGCFWHRHDNCDKASNPKSNTEFWNAKFSRNIKRDRIVKEKIEKTGWKVIVVWECELKDSKRRDDTLVNLITELKKFNLS